MQIFEGNEKAEENETISKRDEEYIKELPPASGEDEIVDKVRLTLLYGNYF